MILKKKIRMWKCAEQAADKIGIRIAAITYKF